VLAAGCGSKQSALDPASPASDEIADLWWLMLVGAVVVFAVVLVLLLVAVLRRRGVRDTAARDSRRARGLVFAGGIAAPLIVLPILFVFAIRALPATSAPRAGETELTIQVVGRQWFWEARYEGSDAVVANEIHIPVGTPVRIEVTTADVIHSFWVPRLNRKIDLIPGRTNSIVLEAERPGVYRGQCAEYCGLQHANMAFAVYADEPARFSAWRAGQARPAAEPAAADAADGRDVFLSEACAGCHTIRGTEADGTLGPDLTHVASRETLAGLTIPNTPDFLAAWIAEPQHYKPGNLMPSLDLDNDELEALVAYLETLR
jgi:cytochrome c oxidase subunit 2